MNRLLYRIVFNRARGMLMVVAEIASTCSGSSPASGIGHTHSRMTGKLSAISFSLWLAGGVIQPVQAAIIADKSAPGNQQPTIIGTANGTPQVNIQTPSAGGVSRNTYHQFDVDQKGVILNNSRQNTSTQLGGMVSANPWLAKGEAKVILNEINARDPSRLNGYIEVAGQKAQVVIANPSGITCDGCGFINAGRATLTTGSVEMQNGSISGYQVDRGDIVIGGKGMDTTRQDHTDIIARAVKVNAALHANDLLITTGRNRVDAAHEQVTASVSNGTVTPQFALDVSQVGGMYAGKIRLRGTENGVGVRNAGHMGAATGEVKITADGMIENSGTLTARGDTTLASNASVNNSGVIWSSSDATITATGHVQNSGSVAASRHTRVNAADITSTATATLASGITSEGEIGNSGDLTLTASGKLETHGLNVAAGNIHASGQGLDASGSRIQAKNITLDARQQNLSTAGARLIADGTLKATTTGTHNNNGGLLAGDTLSLTAKRLQNHQGQVVQSGKQTLMLNHQEGIDNREGRIAANATDLTLQASTIDNRDGEIIHAGNGTLTISSAAFTGDRGSIASSGALTLKGRDLVLDGSSTTAGRIHIDADNLSHRDGQLIQTGQEAMVLDVRHATDNRGGLIAANGALDITAGGLDSRQGLLFGETISLSLDNQELNNQEGVIAAQKNLTISSGVLNNTAGLIQSGSDMRINTHGNTLSNRDSQTAGIISFGKLDVASGALDNQNGLLAGAGDTTLTGTTVDNRNGVLASEADLSLVAQSTDNHHGTISAALDLALMLADVLNNQQGVVSSGKNLTLTTSQLDNLQGVLVSGADATLTSVQTSNQQGQIAAQGNLTLTGQTLDNNNGGQVQSGADMTLAIGDICNRNSGDTGGMTSVGNMQITATTLLNDQGLLFSGKQITLDTGRFSNIAGTFVAQELLRLSTRSDVDNREGLLQGNGVIVNTSDHLLDNRDGTIYSLAAMQLAIAGLNNQNGTLGAKSDLALTASWLDNSLGGRIVGEQASTFTVNRLDNHNGQIQSVGGLLINAVQGVIDNTLGLIRSGATLTLSAASLINRDTQAAEKGIEGLDVEVNGQTLDNTNGMLLSGQNLNIKNAGTLNNTRGELAAGGALSLGGTALNLVNTAGVAKAGENVTVQADRISGDGQLLSLGDMVLNSRQDISNTGEIIANGNLTLTTPGLVSNSGKLLAGAKLNLTSGNLYNSSAGEIAAGYTWLTAANTLTNYGLIDGNWTLLKAGTLTNTGTGRIYGDYVGIQANTLNNLAENSTAATIAGRERVDIGTGTLNNRDHALIYSAGDMVLGGRLDANGIATGQAGVLNNHSSTIESAGNMLLSVGQLNNINDHFSTEVVGISSETLHEYQHNGSPNRWDANAEGVFVDRNSSNSLLNLNTPEDTGHNNDNFYEYQYTRTIEEEVVKESDPGKILSGGHLSISADHVLNDNSQIVAGGTLGILAGIVDNVMPEGRRWIADEGTVTHYSRKTSKGSDSQRKSPSDYVPPVIIQSISLHPGRLEGNSTINSSGFQLDSVTPQGTSATINGTESITAGVNGRDISIADISSRQPVVLKPGQQFEVPVNGGVSDDNNHQAVVRITGPNTQLPDNSLFRTHPEPGSAYLVETDPRFTNNKQWLGSDYMQNAFSTDHDNMHKRLGDGYYEQRLVREQIIALTGGRYLGDHQDDETQFKALMDAGISFGQKYNLIPGVALTAEQMSLLTDDMVWLVNTQVQLADGSWQTVLVPQVYVRVKPGDIDGSGALLGGQNVVMNLNSNLVNSGTVSGREGVQLSADNITNKAGTIQGADVSLQARTDINNIGGIISGNNSVLASAGRDINVTTTTRSAQSVFGSNSFERTTIERMGGIYVQADDGKLSLAAGRDISLTGAQVVNNGKNSQTVLTAERDLNLNTVATSASDNITWDKNNWLKQSATQHAGSEVSGAGSVVMVAGQDVNAQAATVSAGSSLGVGAGRDINITAATDSSEFESKHKYTGSNGAFSKTTITTHDMVNSETVQGSVFSGDNVKMQAGNNLQVQGSHIVADNDVQLKAGNDLTITTTEERSTESHQKQKKTSGLSGTGGIGVTYGSQSLKVTDTAQSVAERGSTVGSVNGNVTLSAGNDLKVKGSELIAGNNMTLVGKNVSVISATENSRQTHEVEQKSSGFTLALSGAAGSAVNSAVQSANQVKGADNDRLAALQGVKAALSGVQASQAVRMDEAQGDRASNNNTVGVSLSYGSQSSKSTQTSEQTTAKGSSLTAGNNLAVIATGSGQKGQDGDILIQGSQINAGNDVLLSANRDVNLLSAENTSRLDGKNESKGGNVGLGIGAGSGGWGINVSASVNAGKGSEKGNGTTHTETTVEAGNNLTVNSGRDANLIGAQVSAEGVMADIGRDLTIRSEQDSDSYHSKQQNVSAGASFNLGSMTGSASVNASRDKMDSHYTSVNEQSGITAGSGGYDIKVGGHTQLDGAVIASSATEDKNRLDTGTLGWRDIHNEAEYKVEHQSVGMSTGGSIGGQFAGNMANTLLNGGNSSDSAEGTTSSAISSGNIIIRDKENQQQNVDDLSRDTANANGSIGQIFDKEKEQQKIQESQSISDIGTQVSDIARTEDVISASQKASEKRQSASPEERDAAKSEWEKVHPGKTATDADIGEVIYQNAYADAMKDASNGTGSRTQQAIQAVTAAVQGLAGGDMNAAIAGAAAPYIAEVIGYRSGLEGMNKVAAHAVANAVLASMQGQNALAGAAGAASGELTGMIALEMYGKPLSELSETEKQTISSLATIASGIAGGVAGDSTSSALAGAQSGKTTVENNLMKGSEDAQAAWIRQHGVDMATCSDNPGGAACQKAMNERDAVELALATGGVALLPGGAQAMWGLGASANAGISYLMDGAIDPANAAIAGWVNVFSMGNGLVGTVGWNAAGGALGNWIDNKDPLSGAVINGAGSGIGYGVGKGLSWGVNVGANWWKGGWDPKFNADLRQFTEVKGELGLSKEMVPSYFPGMAGDIGGSVSSELSGKYIEQKSSLEDRKK